MAVLKNIFRWFASIIGFLIFWWILAVLIHNPFFPTPIRVLSALVYLFQSGSIFPHILGSLRRTLVGFFFALIIGSFLGYTLGLSSFLRNYLGPIVEILRPIPPIAWIPLAILWFGVGDSSASFIIFIASFFPIFTNVYFGVISIPKVYHRVSKNYNLEPIQKFINVIFPFTLPYLITGAKTSIGFGWMAVIAAEMISGNYGLGYFIEVNRVLLNTEYVIAAMIIIGAIGYLMNKSLSLAEIKVTAWRTK
jgi:ABC-type nitrate/sulfonate/bicarbonate transport system permease component